MASNYKINMSDEANDDIKNISNYLEEKLFNKVMKQINTYIDNLRYMPKIHRRIIYQREPDREYRRIVCGKYIIIYKIIKNDIIILRIFNQKENYLNSKKFILKEKSQKYSITK